MSCEKRDGIMKNKLYFGLIALLCLFTLGMGSMGESDVVNIPEPEINYTVNLVDQSDMSIDLEKFSCEGQTYFMGKLGKADISIDFDKINSIFFLLQEDDVKAKVNLKDGKFLEIFVEKNKPCYGVSSFADVRIEMQDIKKITIHGKALKKD